jgi:glycerol-3-phosphate O-acyltransferase / dihydroxyacetone phosphate acyltransferase
LSAILASSGSIPVQRNPNNTSTTSAAQLNGNDLHLELFRETFRALDADEVIGVFPEGTSYTEPQIAQIKDGAAWIALEYARWQIQKSSDYRHGLKKLSVIPVGIVYSDKTHFQSQVSLSFWSMSRESMLTSYGFQVIVEFGEPIDVEPYVRRHLASTDPRTEVRNLTSEIERRIFKLTINAKDW